jgi:hypothetical protein
LRQDPAAATVADHRFRASRLFRSTFSNCSTASWSNESGYLAIGVEEKRGRPVLPPAGSERNQIGTVQRKMIGLGTDFSQLTIP